MVLDAFALVALAADEPAAGEVEGLLRRGDAAITAVNLAEAVDVLGRALGNDPAKVAEVIVPLIGEAVALIEVGSAAAWRAAELRRRHYDRRTSPLSLADCIALAAAAADGALATADPPLAKAARAEGIELVPLLDSGGKRP